MEINIIENSSFVLEESVKFETTAKAVGSGLLEVFATPAMIALMEKTAMMAVSEQMPEGFNTVGTRVEVDHIKATPLGMKVRCEASLRAQDGRKLEFEVVAHDETGLIGKGLHTRFIINEDRFMQKIAQ